MRSRVGMISGLAFLSLATLAFASRPSTANARFAQTSYTPVPIGSCSGMNSGCTGVYGIDWLSDGRMVLLTSDVVFQGNMPWPGRARSKVTLVSGLTGAGPVTTRDIATHFKLPTGVLVVGDRIFVADMDSFYVVPSNDPDSTQLASNRKARFRMPHPMSTGSNPLGFAFPASASGASGGQGEPPEGWNAQNSFWHQYLYTPYWHQGKIHAVYSGATAPSGPATLNPVSYFGGAVLAFDTATTTLDTLLHRAGGGLRSPGGVGNGNGFALVSDNQGGYRPMCELFPVKPFTNQHFGYRQAPGYVANWSQAAYERGLAHYVPSVAVLEWGAPGWRSTAQPLYLSRGPYAGDWLVGDVTSVGIARVAFDSLPDTTGAPNMQGAVFWFAGGNTGGAGTGNNAIHRLSQGPDGAIYAGVLRSVGNWPAGSSTVLLYKYAPNPAATQFEILKIRSVADGFELVLSDKVDPSTALASNFTVQQRNWVRQLAYGSGMGTLTTRAISSVGISNDSLRVHLVVPGIRRLNQQRRGDTITHWITKFGVSNLKSAKGQDNFTNEATYAQNWISTRAWNAAEPTPTPLKAAPPALEQRVWIRSTQGLLRVHLEGEGSHVAILRDLKGRILLRVSARGGVSELRAPTSTPAPYLLEVRSGNEVYRKPVVL